MRYNSLKSKKFSMEDVKTAHSLKPYLPEEKFIKQFAFLNFKISKGVSMDEIVSMYDSIMESKNEIKNIA
jgi:hypothetical protein|tara:strand:+ start:238 stop:447 length:210 start_codon:yes stop_codon:yes gene_type:complete